MDNINNINKPEEPQKNSAPVSLPLQPVQPAPLLAAPAVTEPPCQSCPGCSQTTPLAPVSTPVSAQAVQTEAVKPATVVVSAPGPLYQIPVRFRDRCKIVNCFSTDLNIKEGNNCVVDTADGPQFGQVVKVPKLITDNRMEGYLKFLRVATPEDVKHFYENIQKEKEAYKACQQKIEEKSLEMKLVEADYSLDRTKIVFYFTAEKRMDFRELVKDLAYLLKARIEMRQIGVRDEAKMLGGYGCCGRELCCVSFLKDFIPVTIKMAKVQHLPLNQTKISGMCGRLMCCLAYEQGQYDTIRAAAEDAVKKNALSTPADNGVIKDGTALLKVPGPQSQQKPRQPWNRNNGTNNNTERRNAGPEGRNKDGQRNNNQGSRGRNNDRPNRQNQNNNNNQNNRNGQRGPGNRPNNNNPRQNVPGGTPAVEAPKPAPGQGGEIK